MIRFEQTLLVHVFLFIHKYLYNRRINKTRKAKTKIDVTVIMCKATVTAEIKLIHGLNFLFLIIS